MLRALLVTTTLAVWTFPALARDPAYAGRYGRGDFDAVETGKLVIQGAGSSGNASGLCVAGQDGGSCRPLSARAAENVNTLDQGADPTATSDSFPAFTASGSLAANGKKMLFVPGGRYKLGTSYQPPNDVPFFASGASLLDGNGSAGNFANIADLTKYPTFTFFKSSTTSVTPDGTDNAVNIGFVTRGTSPNINYQKSGLFIRATTEDPGSCTGSPLVGCKDIVALTATGNVAPNIANGRAYGANLTAALGAGSTGIAVGYEVDVYNLTGADHTADFYTGAGGGGKSSIVGSTVICGGNAPCDAAYYVSSLNPGQAKFSSGIRMLRSAIRDYVLEVNDDTSGNLNNKIMSIRADGVANFRALNVDFVSTLSGGLFTTAATVTGDNGLVLRSGLGSATAIASLTAISGPVSVSGPPGLGLQAGMFAKAGAPTTTDLPTGFCGAYFNSTDSTFKYWCNYGGTLRSVAMN